MIEYLIPALFAYFFYTAFKKEAQRQISVLADVVPPNHPTRVAAEANQQ